MMIKVNVLVQEKKWKKYISSPKKYLKNKSQKIKSLIPLKKNCNLVFSILLSNGKKIKSLNKKFRKKNKTTDVLSFPFYGKKDLKYAIINKKEIYLGDIILNYYKIKDTKKADFIDQFNKLWIHGFLHLIGYRHNKNKDFNKMAKLESIIFKKIK
tara:strand:+ start:32 stop:496 length:465 start_codon:yes stop_codon:yes gene_type:complete